MRPLPTATDTALATTIASDHDHVLSNNHHGLIAREDLRRPSPVATAAREFSARTLHFLMYGTLRDSDADESLASSNDSDLENPNPRSSSAPPPEPRNSFFGALQPQAVVATCQICLDETPVDETAQLSACGHRFCRSCLQQFLTLKINEAQVKLTCFYEIQKGDEDASVCGVAIARSDVQQLVSSPLFAKFEKFQFNQSHHFARQCPHCEFSQVCDGPDKPKCICSACGKLFCFTHGNAHEPTESCTQYDKKQLRMEKRNRRKIRRISKPCPSCKTPVEKNGGCNHMRCLTCSADFCWLCGEKLSELISDHYDWTNVRGCAGQQMVHIHGLTTTNVCMRYLARVTLYLVVYPVAFVITLAVMLLSCCFALCIVPRDVKFVQVFRWLFRVIAICGYTALELSAVTIVTGFAAGIFGICWCCHALYKLGKKSVRRCCAGSCSSCTRPWSRSKHQPQPELSPHVLECDYQVPASTRT